jgi:hypothetical protein
MTRSPSSGKPSAACSAASSLGIESTSLRWSLWTRVWWGRFCDTRVGGRKTIHPLRGLLDQSRRMNDRTCPMVKRHYGEPDIPFCVLNP